MDTVGPVIVDALEIRDDLIVIYGIFDDVYYMVSLQDTVDIELGIEGIYHDELNVLMPEGYMAPVVVSELYDGKMNPVEDCPHPEMTFYMKAVSSADGKPVELSPMTFLSRDGDKDFGIPAPV